MRKRFVAKGGAVLRKRSYGLRTAVKVIKNRSRQAALCQAAQVLDIDIDNRGRAQSSKRDS